MDQLDHDYQNAGFGGSLGLGERPALILVDFVAGYYRPDSPLYSEQALRLVEPALVNALRLREAAHEADVPVVLTEVSFTEPEMASILMTRKAPVAGLFDQGSRFAAFAEGLEPRPNELIVRKHFPSAFFATSLASMFTVRRIDTAIICGLTTSGCVRATCLDALCHGFVPVVVEDAVGDRDEAPHRANLFDLKSKYADVLSSEAILSYFAELQSNAGCRQNIHV